MNVTDEPCSACKEAPNRDTKYTVELPNTTRKLRLKVRVCPFCDGEELIRLASRPNDQEEQSIP